MFVNPADYRPVSSLTSRPIDPAGALGGLAAFLLAYGTIAILGWTFSVVTGRSILDERAIGDEPPPEEPVEPEIVEAGFVQLGREWDPRELPDRRIESAAQAARAQDPNVVSPFQRLLNDAGVPPPNRALTSLLDTSAAYDQQGNATLLYEQAGQAWGDSQAREGDMVLGQLVSLVRRGLEVPPNLPESDYARTRARISVTVGPDWVVQSIQMTSPSGNEDWDRSVRNRIDQIADSRPRLQPQEGSSPSSAGYNLTVYPIAARRRSGGSSGGGGGGGGSGGALDRLLGN